MIRLPYSLVRSVVATTLALILLSTTRTFAQNPSDTTAATPVIADSIKPIPQLARINLGTAHGFSEGVWVWEGHELHNETAISVGDLLERLPGVQVLRTGLALQPEAAAVLGGVSNRVEVWLDGYMLNPMLESSIDLSRISLSEVESVRVERRLGRVRIHIETIKLHDNRAYSRIEAGVGQPNHNVFRGLFATPHLIAGPAGLALDRIDTNGTQGKEPANQTSAWAQWSYVHPSGSGFQLEYRRGVTTRDPVVPWVEKYSRGDLIARGRLQLAKGLVAEAFGGLTNVDRDTSVSRDDSIPEIDDDNVQFGGRVGFDSPYFFAWGAAHMNDAPSLPSTQFDGTAGLRYKLISATAEATQASWRDAGSASEINLRAEAGPFHGFRVFGETTSSNRGASYLLGLPDSAALLTKYTGYRAGAQLDFWGITAGGAFLHVKSDSTPGFGLPFDRSTQRYFGPDATGFEVMGRIPLPLIKGLYAEGMLTDWNSGNVAIYLPTRTYRAGLELHAIPLPSRNLEILGRIEAIQRGQMLAPNPDTTNNEPVVTMPAINYYDAYLQIRIMDVRGWIRLEDLTSQQLSEVPGRVIRGARMIYGVQWQFFN